MEEVPLGFIFILLGIFIGAIVLTIGAFLLRQRKVSRLKNPRKDYYR